MYKAKHSMYKLLQIRTSQPNKQFLSQIKKSQNNKKIKKANNKNKSKL
jgi:hypothetical protein